MSGKAFASVGDMTEKKISFTEIGRNLYAFTAEGDPNTGVIIGDNAVMIVDAQATPRLAGTSARSRIGRSSMSCFRTIMPCVCSVPPHSMRARSSRRRNATP
jgi:hypothetical protein